MVSRREGWETDTKLSKRYCSTEHHLPFHLEEGMHLFRVWIYICSIKSFFKVFVKNQWKLVYKIYHNELKIEKFTKYKSGSSSNYKLTYLLLSNLKNHVDPANIKAAEALEPVSMKYNRYYI